MRALCLLAIGFGNWDRMEKKRRAQGLVMVPLEALTGAMKNVAVLAPQPPLPEAGTAATRGTGPETEIGSGTEIEIEIGTGSETETGIEIETGIGIETGTGIETETETERALSAGRTHSLNAGPLGRGTLSTCMEKT